MAPSGLPQLHQLLPPQVGGFLPPQGDPALAQLEVIQRQLDALHHSRLQQEGPAQQDSQVQCSSASVSLDSLFNAHAKNPQYRALDFAKLGKFSYTSQLKSYNNVNLALFSYGTIKHLLALCDGTLPKISHSEFISRLQHYLNVMEITCLSSTLNEFDHYGFRIAREYDNKVINDLEAGLKSWNTLDKNIDAMAWTYAKEVVPRVKPAGQSNSGKINAGAGQKMCTTWNSFRKEGCHYEHTNPGEYCVFLHICSKCKAKGLHKRHKAYECSDIVSAKSQPVSTASTSSTTPAIPTTSA